MRRNGITCTLTGLRCYHLSVVGKNPNIFSIFSCQNTVQSKGLYEKVEFGLCSSVELDVKNPEGRITELCQEPLLLA